MPAESFVAANAGANRTGQTVFVFRFRRELQDSIDQGTYQVQLGQPREVNIGRELLGGRNQARTFSAAARVRQANDLARASQDAAESFQQRLAAADAAQETWNQRVSTVLNSVAGAPPQTTPRQWWNWWGAYASVEVTPTSEKPVEEEYEREVVEAPTFIAARTASSCLPAGTLIAAETGLTPIEQIRSGDRVLSKDIVTGELAYRPVILTTARAPQPLRSLRLGEETIAATRGHYFWVSGQGWWMATEIKPGHRLHGVNGTVDVVAATDGEVAAVYNLVVEKASTYFVGRSRILSHDVTPPTPTNIVVPGLAAR